LYQARRSIVSKDRCILVEGYMDVISMSQSGVENVVASSGTSLTDGQVRIIHRFTKNVTVIYDADAAGIKASLRGVDMLLAEGLNVSVVLFPEGEDPDSFAQSHTCEELTDYLRENETDFIRFKTKILLDDAAEDPIRRSHAIADILKSIAVIPDNIARQVYIEECSRQFGIDAKILALEVAKGVAKIAEDTFIRKEREKTAATIEKPVTPANQSPTVGFNPLEPFERALARYIVRYGMLKLCDSYDEDNQVIPMTVMEYILCELDNDEIKLSDDLSVRILQSTSELAQSWSEYQSEVDKRLETERSRLKEEGMNRIRETAASLSEIQAAESALNINIEDEISKIETSSRRTYFERNLINHPDDSIRRLVTEFVDDRYQLSKVHSKYAHVETEEERLTELVPRAVYEYKDAILSRDISDLKKRISTAAVSEPHLIDSLLTDLMEKTRTKAEFAKFLGERIVTPSIMTPKR
ncbi:MAG: toprim domain-containing protein, partial [Muribaculaceae bacterium]|nr:toprim domain-containing protein [Muribaculaceae bacterium]